MAITAILFCTILALAGSCAGQDISQLENHLSHLTEVRHPGEAGDTRAVAREYIKNQLLQYNLTLYSHTFNTTITVDGRLQTVQGENIVGVSEGGIKEGAKVVVVGADYDTHPDRTPLEDNGAGVGVLLEVARNYRMATDSEGGVLTAQGTVIFVAFDLNTKEYSQATGQPGSYQFLQQWLWPYLQEGSYNLTGAFILDSISNFNSEPNTQYLPSTFQKTFPEGYERISGRDTKGNFLAAFTRGNPQAQYLAQALSRNYLRERKAQLIPLEELRLMEGAALGNDVLAMIKHQAHLHFWTFQTNDTPTPLPAILLTDTDVYRRPSENDTCASPCPAHQFLNRKRRVALTVVTSALTSTLTHLQATRRPSTGGSTGGHTGSGNGCEGSALPSLAWTTLLLATAQLLR